jgi:hypothetical protein
MHSVMAPIVLLTCLSALAQPPAAIKELESAPTFRATAEKTFLQYENSLSMHCLQITPDWSHAQQRIYVAPLSNAEGKLVSGMWTEMVPGLACGQLRNFRTLVLIRDGRFNFLRALPGTSNVGQTLEVDARLAVLGALRIHHPQENPQAPFDILDTELVGPNPPPIHQSWKDIWLVGGNGREMRVPIEFVPDQTGSGTSFHVNPNTIVDVPKN